MKNSPALALAFFFALFLSAAQSVAACSCAGTNSPCAAFQNKEVVFIGTATEIIKPDSQRRSRMRLKVEEAFKGVAAKEEIVEVGGVCSFNFKEGQSYLVYARRDKATNLLDVFLCSGTKLLENAGQDLEFIRMIVAGKTVGSLYGKVRQPTGKENPSETPLSKIRVAVLTDYVRKGDQFVAPKTQDRERETLTDAEGQYRFDDLPVGNHRLKIFLPDDLIVWKDEIEVSTGKQSCAQYDFRVQVDGRVSGKIVSDAGDPVAGMPVRLSSLEYNPYQFIPEGRTDQDGNYEIKGIPPGKYKVRVSPATKLSSGYPFYSYYYPATFSDREAQAIEIGYAEKIANINLKLPPAAFEKKIKIEVYWEDGTLITPPNVHAKVLAGSAESTLNYVPADQSGTPTLTIFSGFKYQIYAFGSFPDGRLYETDTVIVAAESAEDVIRLKARLRR